MRKNITAGAGSRNQISDAERRANWQKFTEAVSAILADEATPVFIYNDLAEFVLGVCDATRVTVMSRELMAVALPLAVERALTGQTLLK